MKPIEFKEQNIVVAKDQPEYKPLPALIGSSNKGEVVTCWQLSFNERLKLLFTGKVWMMLLMFRNSEGKLNPITPSYLTVDKSDLIKKE